MTMLMHHKPVFLQVFNIVIIRGMFPEYYPSHMREEKSLFDIMRVAVRVCILMMTPVKGRPFERRTLKGSGPKKEK